MSPAADSAGQPFEGRAFHANPYAGDEGLADTTLADALQNFHALFGDGAPPWNLGALGEAWTTVIEAVRGARLLSPLIAEAGEMGLTEQGLVVEKTQELSVVHLESPDGRAVAPVFMDVASMTHWRLDARPIPVDARKAAIAALSDGLSLMVLNPGSVNAVTLRRGVLTALASGDPYTPAWNDPAVEDAIAESISTATGVSKHRVLPGDPSAQLAGPELIVAIGVEPGLDGSTLDHLVEQIATAWASSEVLTRLVDGLGLKVLPV